MNNEKNKLIGHGLILPIIDKTHWVLGASQIPNIVIQSDGQWLEYLPDGEWQARANFDTYGCVDYNTLNALEILETRLYGIKPNYAERPVYIGVGITPPGSDPHIVSEWIRNNGLCKESSLPFDDTVHSLEEYRQPNPLTSQLIDEGKKWRITHIYQHQWVILPEYDLKQKQQNLMHELQYSPLGIAVQAWNQRDGFYYQDGPPNHWTVLVGYIKGEYWLIYDSYEPYTKKMEWSTDFQFAKRYHIEKQSDGCNFEESGNMCIRSPRTLTFFDHIKRGFAEIMK